MSGTTVAVDKAPLPMTEATRIQATVVRPDDSVVEREAVAVDPKAILVKFHDDDLTLPGTYVGQVSCWVGGAVSIFAPAFTIEVSPS